jgi:starch phosphorylase
MFADKPRWAEMQRHCLAMNGTFFNTHRMLGQYCANAYWPPAASIAASDQVVVSDLVREGVLV